MKKNSKLKFIFSSLMIVSIVGSISILATSCVTENVINPRKDLWNYIENDTEQYINDNSFSILKITDPNKEYVSNYLQKFLNQEPSITGDLSQNDFNIIKQIIQTINDKLSANDPINSQWYNTSLGTGWVFDYANVNENLSTYYIASNIHVFNDEYVFKFKYNNLYNFSLSIPASKDSINDISYYISQPLGSRVEVGKNIVIPIASNVLNDYWYKLNVTKDNIANSLIPIGAYTEDGNKPTNNPRYDMKIKLEDNSGGYSQFMLSTNPTNNEIVVSNKLVLSTMPASDFGLLKTDLDYKKIFTNSSNSNVKKIYENLQQIFNIQTNNDTTKPNSSYISKLNKLISLSKNDKIITNEFNDLFLFKDQKQVSNDSVISIGGFPSRSDRNNVFYSVPNFNSISKSLANTNNALNSNAIKPARQFIEYNIDGKYAYNSYDSLNNWLLQDVNLSPGSSGSSAMTNDYKLLGIYWGILFNNENSNVRGVISNLYSKYDSNSLVYRYLKYININNPKSKLLELFIDLKNKNYFLK